MADDVSYSMNTNEIDSVVFLTNLPENNIQLDKYAAEKNLIVKPSDEDCSEIIEQTLVKYGICLLEAGDYHIKSTGIKMPDSSTLIGAGLKTRIILDGDSDYTPGQCVSMGSYCTIRDISFWGWQSEPSGITSTSVQNRHGILWTGEEKVCGNISNCYFKYFKGGAITCVNTTSAIRNCLNVSSCFIEYCRCGIYIPSHSEYHRFTNVYASLCAYGCLNNGGNNMFVNCLFTKNKIGFAIDNSSGDKPNNSHGSAVGCTFNHSDNNNGIGVKISNTTHGFVFSGCQMFYSSIELNDVYGVCFAHTNFGRNEKVVVNNGGLVMFDGCMYGSAPVKYIENNNKVKFINCFTREGDIVE